MRAIAPLLAFVFVLGVYWMVGHDTAGMMSMAPPEARHFILIFVGVVFWLTTAWALTSLLTVTVLQIAQRRRTQNKLPKFLVDVAAMVIFFGAGLVIISQVFEQSLAGVLATSGVLAAVIGFAVQRTIADVIAGIALNVEQPFKIGDWIELPSGVVGQAVEITWRTTHLYTRDGRLIIVPNAMLIGDRFANFSAPQRYFRVARKIEIDYNIPPERAVGILQSAMVSTPGVLEQPEPIIYIDECGANGIVYSMNYWVPDYPESFPISREVVAQAVRFLDRAGISPVYPHQDVTLFEAGPRRIEHKVDVAPLLARTPFFQPLAEDAVKRLAEHGLVREFPAGTVVVREGEAGDSLFVVIAGMLDVSKSDDRKGPRSVGRLGPGEIFGEMSLLTGAPRGATVRTSTHSLLFEIGKAQLQPVLADSPDAIVALSDLMAQRAAINESVLALWPDEQRNIATLGVAAFLRERISRFFGRATV
jgi:small-conductance mechanosensitive channel/CRP-like cAMP-binding protein